jgi:hypothetical protein
MNERCDMRNFKLTFIFILALCTICPGCSCTGTANAWSPDTNQDNNPSGNNSGNTTAGLKFLFIHHSTGEGFLYDGGMYDQLIDAGFDVHTRTYDDGWVGDNTDPEHWPITFTSHFDDMMTWDLPTGERYDIIAFKSCYPASYIDDSAMLNEYKGYYNTVKSVVEEHPGTLFIPFTTPPLVPAYTEPSVAARAREFANWMTGPYDDGVDNLAAYDVFDVLAGDNSGSGDYNCLRYSYQYDAWDSHPNVAGCTAVANEFVDWLVSLGWGS